MGLWSKSTTPAEEKPQETVEKRNEAVDDDEPDEWQVPSALEAMSEARLLTIILIQGQAYFQYRMLG